MLTTQHIQIAYRKLKRSVYYEKTDLNLRLRLARFECDPNFEENLLIVKNLINGSSPAKNPIFKKWLNEINFRIVPKKLKDNENTATKNGTPGGKFIKSAKIKTNIVFVKNSNLYHFLETMRDIIKNGKSIAEKNPKAPIDPMVLNALLLAKANGMM